MVDADQVEDDLMGDALLADRDALALLAAPKVKPETPPGMPIGDDDYGVLN